MDVVDSEADCISLDMDVTIASLSRKLTENATLATGFPIIRDDDGLRLQGYIGFDELEQAIETYNTMAGSEVPPTPCSFRDITARIHFDAPEGVASPSGTDVLDLGYLVDRAPVTISSRAPLQLVHQYFIRLGVRYLAVQDERGCYVGVIDKNRSVLLHL
jgi:chloride channel 3/4/5